MSVSEQPLLAALPKVLSLEAWPMERGLGSRLGGDSSRWSGGVSAEASGAQPQPLLPSALPLGERLQVKEQEVVGPGGRPSD